MKTIMIEKNKNKRIVLMTTKAKNIIISLDLKNDMMLFGRESAECLGTC